MRLDDTLRYHPASVLPASRLQQPNRLAVAMLATGVAFGSTI